MQISILVEYLSWSYGVKFEMLVCDFIKDEIGNSFFTNCKSFRLADADKLTKIAKMNHGQWEYIEEEHNVIV